MSIFSYRALDERGQEVKGQVSSGSKKLAFATLRERGLSPVSIQKEFTLKEFKLGLAASEKQKARVIRQLAVLLNAGLPLADAIESISGNSTAGNIPEQIAKMRTDLRAGARFSTVLSDHFEGLPPYVVRLAELGEATGNLGPTMMEAADKYEYDLELNSEIRAALAYPSFLVVAGSLIVLLLCLFVVPQFADLLENSDGDIPGISKMVINSSVWLKANLTLALAIFAVLAVIGFSVRDQLQKAGRAVLEGIPVTRNMLIAGDMARWCSTLQSALKHGSGMLEALSLAEPEIRSPKIRAGLERTRKSVRGGEPLEVAIEKHLPDFDGTVLDMIKSGRRVGRLPEMLEYSAEAFRRDTKERTQQVTALIEPSAILVISLIVGTIVISIVLAMTSLYELAPS